ncbi:hypothetical protein BKA70DRAFT_1253193 [Coprinopsis sp. MPI-PUGE-AT-0042]|nr:hypothetical protein BKA70DRAFT_1253193 [Coprinopsis sp. MPI-PUGE-AT-0042]
MKLSTTLPDGIINEILPSLLDAAWISLFSCYELTTSTVLIVCKAWLRIATPLLNHSLILRSTAQAQALARTLKEDAQPGHFTRKSSASREGLV